MVDSFNFSGIFKTFEEFLSKAKEFGIIKDYSLNYDDKDACNKPLPEVGSALKVFLCKLEELKDDLFEVNDKLLTNCETIQELNSESNKCQTVQEVNEVIEIDDRPEINEELVQIKVDRKEVDRRIQAFITRKRKEVDEWNVQEFCSRPFIEDENLPSENSTCARVDALFVARSGSRSHVKVSTVVNQWGPQTRIPKKPRTIPGISPIKEESPDFKILPAIEERLKNMESHLKLKSGHPVPNNIYLRLKNLEDRILYLEGLSPDYFVTYGNKNNFSHESPVKNHKQGKYSNWTLGEIDTRIQLLKEKLIQKSRKANLC